MLTKVIPGNLDSKWGAWSPATCRGWRWLLAVLWVAESLKQHRGGPGPSCLSPASWK